MWLMPLNTTVLNMINFLLTRHPFINVPLFIELDQNINYFIFTYCHCHEWTKIVTSMSFFFSQQKDLSMTDKNFSLKVLLTRQKHYLFSVFSYLSWRIYFIWINNDFVVMMSSLVRLWDKTRQSDFNCI